MFLVLLRREILAHLITFRFAVTVITCLLLVIITTLIRIDDYEKRLAGYNTVRNANREELLSTRTYSFLSSFDSSSLILIGQIQKVRTQSVSQKVHHRDP